MEAIVVTGPAEYSFVPEQPIPEPGPGEVRVRVLAAGICGTDVHIVRGDQALMDLIRPPLVLGHEFCGEVDSCGDGVPGLEKGEYVSAEMHFVCWECAACREGKAHACAKTKVGGIHGNGAFAEYVVVPKKNVVKLPKSIPVKVGAILDALGNAVHSTLKADIRDRSVAIVGYGPIGAMAAEIALFSKARHISIFDVADRALERAERWCALRNVGDKVSIIDAKSKNDAVLNNPAFDVVLEFSGAPSGINTAFRIIRPGGVLSLLGLPREREVTIDDYGKNLIWKGLTIHGIIGREMFKTWDTMIRLIGDGLDVTPLITAELPLRDFRKGAERFRDGLEQKVVLYPGR